MKSVAVITVLCAFGVFQVSAAATGGDSIIAEVLDSVVNGYNATVTNALDQLACDLNTVLQVASDIVTDGDKIIQGAVDDFVDDSVKLLSGLTNEDPSDINKCSKLNDATKDVTNKTMQSVVSCASSALSSVEQSLKDALDLGKQLEQDLDDLVSKATSSCLSPSTLVSCVSDLLGEIPTDVDNLSSKVVSLGVEVAVLDPTKIASSCSASAITLFIGTSCTILTELGNCIQSLSSGNNK